MVLKRIGLAGILLFGFLGCKLATLLNRTKIAIFLLLTVFAAMPISSYAAMPECRENTAGENLAFHFHVVLLAQITYTEDGEIKTDLFNVIPPEVGLREGCTREIHTHDPDGVLHIESKIPGKTFTLGDFLDLLWQDKKLSIKYKDGRDPKVVKELDGVSTKVNDYRAIELKPRMIITIHIDLTTGANPKSM